MLSLSKKAKLCLKFKSVLTTDQWTGVIARKWIFQVERYTHSLLMLLYLNSEIIYVKVTNSYQVNECSAE